MGGFKEWKVFTLTDELIGAEALLRWHNPALGEVLSLRFIPVAEDNGLILQIGEWIIQTVIDAMKGGRRDLRCQNGGKPFTTSV